VGAGGAGGGGAGLAAATNGLGGGGGGNASGGSGAFILSIPTQFYSGVYTNAAVSTNGVYTVLTYTTSGTYQDAAPAVPLPVMDRIAVATKAACRGAYSPYRLSMAYVGPTINLRRSSDSATSDFYGNVTGGLFQAVYTYTGGAMVWVGASLSTWLGASTAYVAVLYDQSGSGNHATQTVAAAQPVLNTTSLLIDFLNSSSLWLNMPSGTVPVGVLNAQYTFVLKHGTINNTSGGGIISSGGYSQVTNQNNVLRMGGGGYYNYWYGNDYAYGSYAAGNRVVVKYDGTNRTGYVNAVAQTPYANSGYTNAANIQYIGKDPYNDWFNGQLYYVYIFGIAIPDADRTILSV
jgi:hypothetical protein